MSRAAVLERPLPLAWRLAGVVGAAALAFVASPGVSGRDGSLLLAVFAVALWAWTVAHPLGPRPWCARLVEWFGGTLAGGLMMWWVSYIVVFGVLYIGGGFGVYFVAMGAFVRRLARRFPLALAVGLAWSGVELVRALVPPPFGLGWFRLGYYAHAHEWLSGSARVIGVEGLSFVLAALGGGLAALAWKRRLSRGDAFAALAPFALALLAARSVPSPLTVEGPRVLLVQPGLTQHRKQFDDPSVNLAASCDLTHRAATEVGPVDLVCWGESMLYIQTYSRAAEAAIRAGTARAPAWDPQDTPATVDAWLKMEHTIVANSVLGLGQKARPLEGASFAVGVECMDVDGGALKRKVALVLYDAAAQRSPPAFKQYLVPLGETFFGLERFGWVRDLAKRAAGYLPDLGPGSGTGVVELRARDGRTYRLSGSVCFDNAHPWPYLDALRGGPVDFHLVASNEAWYETSCEMDQMVAFTRVFALMTGRSFVRATNSGVSLVMGPDGRELGRVQDGSGADRAVAGFGAWTVPVPAPGTAGNTPYVAWSGASEALVITLLALATLLAGSRGNRAEVAG